MEKIAVILLEDNTMDAELTRALLESEGFNMELKQVDCEADFVTSLRGSKPDLIISDYSLPSYNGKSALTAALNFAPNTPFIFYSGTIGEEAAIEALKLGATDYVLKQKPKRLVSAIRRALEEVKLKEKQQAAERKILAQAQLLDLARDAIIVRDIDDKVLFWNQGAERLYGYSRAEAEGKWVQELIDPSTSPIFQEAKKQTLESGYWAGELELKTKEKRLILVASHWTLVVGESGQAERILSISTDITEKKQMEKQFLRAQRLESVGTLASGIAHDLNNILAPIFMASEILRDERLRPEAAAMVNTIQLSARRGAEVVKQVLTFVRGSEGKRTPVSMGYLLKDIAKVASETFPKNIDIHCQSEKGLWMVTGDITQLHQVLMNLCVNARDAMPDGGKLEFSARNVLIESGSNVLVEVRDKGTGIPAEIIDKIFDPFFTTKDIGKGTGLGLSTVLGIVKSHGGVLKVESREQEGTCFQILLPADPTLTQGESPARQAPIPRGHGELILVVDDEPEIRKVFCQALVKHGYEVVTAEDGSSGVLQFVANKAMVKMVITDIMMPGVDGATFARVVRAMNPKMKIMVASGMAEKRNVPEACRMLQKPFSSEDLLRSVYEVLHSEEIAALVAS